MEQNMQEVQAYLKECGAFFIATADGDQPRVRPFGVSEIINGRALHHQRHSPLLLVFST